MPQLQQAQIPCRPDRSRLIAVKGTTVGTLGAGLQILPGKVIQIERHDTLCPFPVGKALQLPDKIEIHLRKFLRDKQSALRGDPLEDRLRRSELNGRVPCTDILHNVPPSICKQLRYVKGLQIFLKEAAGILKQDLLE